MIDNSTTKPTLTTQVLKFVDDEGVLLFHTPDNKAYAEIRSEHGRTCTPINSSQFYSFVHKLTYTKTQKALNRNQTEEVINTLSAKALYDGPKHIVHLRVGATDDGGIEVDLANDNDEVVRITQDGWSVLPRTLKFRRPEHMQPLPTPVHGGNIDDLWSLVNVTDPGDRALVKCWLANCFKPHGPYPILIIQAEKGSGKTTAMGFLKGLVDPSMGINRSLPRNEDELFIAANDNRLLTFDNLTGMKGSMSDMFCRISTGGTFGKRKLYTDMDEVLIDVCRPVAFNGIEDIASRADLISRSLMITLPRLANNNRLSLEDLQQRYHELSPGMFGNLMTAVYEALFLSSSVELEEMPRLVDFAKFATAAESALSVEDGTVVRTMLRRQSEQDQDSVRMDPVGIRLIKLIEQTVVGSWSGTMTNLLDELTPDRAPRGWLSSARVLSQRIKHLVPQLRELGIEVEERRGKERTYEIRKTWDDSDVSVMDVLQSKDGVPF